jgi:CHASE2 domain-containing sensor protein
VTAGRRVALAVGVALVAAAVAVGAHAAGLLAPVERTTYDARFGVRGDRAPDHRIVIVGLDENSIPRLPRFPFARRNYVRLLDRLHAAGARLVLFDIAFDAPTSDDRALLAAARRDGPVIFGTTEIDSRGGTSELGGTARVRRAGSSVASLRVRIDPDGQLRRLAWAAHGVGSAPVLAARLLGVRPRRGAFGGGGALIDYAGPHDTYPTIPMYVPLRRGVTRAQVGGHIVLVGATAQIFQDQHPTPRGTMSGTEIQANALATILDGVPLQPAAALWTALLAFLLALVAPLVALRRHILIALAATGVALVVYLVAVQLAFNGGTVLNVSTPLLAALLSAAMTVVGGYVLAGRELRSMREQFAAGAQDVVADVLEHRPGGLSPDAVIGGYRVDAVAGRGGMAVVYRATQQALDRRVALKLIAPEFARNESFRERFLDESRAAAAVEDPHVIPIYEAGDDRGLLFIAMRFVDGIDLDALITRLGPPDPADAVRITGQIASALDAAHAAGLVHRDVKPANVLLTDDLRHAYLTDFGIARATDATVSMSSAGTFVGTADYAAPEQISGAPVDGRADLYALGGLLYRALTGRLPFPRDSLLAVMSAHVDAPPPKPSESNPALAPFDQIIATAMAKPPAQRYPTGAALAAAVHAALTATTASK